MFLLGSDWAGRPDYLVMLALDLRSFTGRKVPPGAFVASPLPATTGKYFPGERVQEPRIGDQVAPPQPPGV